MFWNDFVRVILHAFWKHVTMLSNVAFFPSCPSNIGRYKIEISFRLQEVPGPLLHFRLRLRRQSLVSIPKTKPWIFPLKSPSWIFDRILNRWTGFYMIGISVMKELRTKSCWKAEKDKTCRQQFAYKVQKHLYIKTYHVIW